MTPLPRARRVGVWMGIALVWVYTVAHYVRAAFFYQGYGDFFLLMQTVREWLATGKFYSDYVYLYPPFFYLLNAPLAHLADAQAVQVMLALNHVLLVGCLWLTWYAIRPRPSRLVWWGLLVPLALNFRPLLLFVSMAKIEMLQLTLLMGALLAWHRNHQGLTGALAAVAGMLKPLPLLFMLYFVWKRRWRAMWAWGLTVIGVLALCSLFITPQHVLAYFVNVAVPRGINVTFWYEDQSLAGVPVRWFAPVQPDKFFLSPTEVFGGAVMMGWVLRLALGVWLAVLLRPRRADERMRLNGEWSIMLAGMLLLSPFTRDYYAVFLMPALLFLAAWLHRQSHPWRRAATWLGLVAYLLIGQGVPLSVVNVLPSVVPGVDNARTYLHYGVPMVGYVLLIAAWAWGWREAEPQPQDVPEASAPVMTHA